MPCLKSTFSAASAHCRLVESLQQVPNQILQPYNKMGSVVALNSMRVQSKLEMPCRQHWRHPAKAALRAFAQGRAMASLNQPCVSKVKPRCLHWWTFRRGLPLY